MIRYNTVSKKHIDENIFYFDTGTVIDMPAEFDLCERSQSAKLKKE
jgi:hypothetical protein